MKLTPVEVANYIKQFTELVETYYNKTHYISYHDPCNTVARAMHGYDIENIGSCLIALAKLVKISRVCLCIDSKDIATIPEPIFLNIRFLRICADSLRNYAAHVSKQTELWNKGSYTQRAKTLLGRAEHIRANVMFLTTYMEIEPPFYQCLKNRYYKMHGKTKSEQDLF